jgi:hypothetical protein
VKHPKGAAKAFYPLPLLRRALVPCKVDSPAGVWRRDWKLPELLVNCSPGLPNQGLKQGILPLEIAKFGNPAKPEGNFSGFSDNPPAGKILLVAG